MQHRQQVTYDDAESIPRYYINGLVSNPVRIS